MTTQKIIILIVLVVLCILSLWLINYLTRPLPLYVSAWLTYFDFPDSFQAFKNNAMLFNEINPFIYAFNKEGAIIKAKGFSDGDLKNILAVARQNKIRVIPTIVNDVIIAAEGFKDILKDPAIIHLLLGDDAAIKKHLEAILSLVKNDAVDGIEIDYENLNVEDKEKFVEFIKLLSQRLHQDAKLLNLVLETKVIEDKNCFFSAEELLVISDSADTLKIMCYPLHGPFSQPGPISTSTWIKQILKEAIGKIPKDKICIALALHGFDWSKNGVQRVGYKKALELANQYNSKILSSQGNIPHFSYSERGVKHFVWFEDRKSIATKVRAVSQYGVNKIAFWRLSGELEPVFYAAGNLVAAIRRRPIQNKFRK